ncbi:MAG: insulinase family protein [Bacillaceae bacterium]|nr:insulinase family protein [Bacillaceae bacterium]
MIEKLKLSNGVRVVVERIPSVRSVAIGIWVGTGSKYETPLNNGISHFIEHMMFKGTRTRSAREIAEAFDQIGGNVNAFTSKEYTCYYARILDEHAVYALDILADMYFNSVFDPDELKKEVNVVIEEIRMYDDTPDDLVHDLISRVCYRDHPLGYSILGSEQVLKSLSRDDLFKYIEDRYTPENTVIAVAGNVTDELLEQIETHFAQYQNKGSSEVTLNPPVFTRGAIHQKKETEQSHLCISFPGYAIDHENLYSLILLNNVLGGSMSSRLFQEVREERGLAYSVFSYHSSFKDSGMFTIYAGTAHNQLEQVHQVVFDILQEIRDRGISEEELEKGKQQLKGSLMLSLESTSSRMSRLGKNELLLGRHLNLDDVIERVDAVSMSSVKKVTEDVLTGEASLALVSPHAGIPEKLRSDILV